MSDPNNVIPLRPGMIPLVGADVHIEAAAVLGGALEQDLTQCLVVGTKPDGSMYARSTEGAADTLWTIEWFKLWLLSGGNVPGE